MFEFKLPDIGEGLHEAELLEWDVKVGDAVAEGDSIAQVSTDKVNVELPSPRAGVIAELPWNPGDVIPVGEVIARIDDGKKSAPEPNEIDDSGVSKESPSSPKREERKPVKAPPVVRRYAAEKGVDLSMVTASGAGGMISKVDVDAHLAGESEQDKPDIEGVTRKVLSGPRLAAAKRLEESWRTLATTAITFEVNADHLSKLVESSDGAATPLSVVAECLCRAVEQHPDINATVDEASRALDIHEGIHLGIAVDSPDGLLVPVIRNAAEKTAVELAEKISRVAEQARAGQLAVSDFQGSTFTISSTGSIEQATITSTTPVINYPNVATLWMSRINQRPRVINGELGVGPVMNCTLAFDHRFIQGADATRFINTLTRLLNPQLEKR
ncbi:MAG TPA: dihydrolipoamide acetyltransferase family protein [Xanthomonadales bacterium]|nr:dihydrolipoamide acetyltransferase family protein [Xanthomonadales bacterium]